MKIIYKSKDNKEFDNERDCIYHEKELEKNTEINTTQLLVFDLIKRASFNGFDGEHVVSYLSKNKDKWVGVMFEIEEYTLRDIDDDFFHMDTLLVKCKDEESAKTFMPYLKKNCYPDEIRTEFEGDDKTSRLGKNVIRLWWD